MSSAGATVAMIIVRTGTSYHEMRTPLPIAETTSGTQSHRASPQSTQRMGATPYANIRTARSDTHSARDTHRGTRGAYDGSATPSPQAARVLNAAFILVVSLALLRFPEARAYFPPFSPPTVSWPTNPGAHCVNRSDLQPSDLPDPTCLQYITYDSIYMDDLTPIRVQASKYAPRVYPHGLLRSSSVTDFRLHAFCSPPFLPFPCFFPLLLIFSIPFSFSLSLSPFCPCFCPCRHICASALSRPRCFICFCYSYLFLHWLITLLSRLLLLVFFSPVVMRH